MLIFKKSIIFLLKKLRILNKSTIFVSTKGDNYEGTTWTILLRTTKKLLGSMAVDFRVGNRCDGKQSERVFRYGGGKRVCMEDEWLGQTFKEVKLV